MILIEGARIVSSGDYNGEFRDILIENDRILDVVAPGSVKLSAERIDAQGMLIVPGLVNAHTHAHGNLAKGVADLWPLEVFLSWGPWTLGRALEHYQVSALLGAAEMVRKGCTAAYDLFAEYPVHSQEGINAVADAYMQVGVRAVLAPMMADLSVYEAMPGLLDALPADLRSDVAAIRYSPGNVSIAACREAARNWSHPTDKSKFALGPTIPHHCTDEFLVGLRDLAREYDLGIHMHVAESKPDVMASIDRYGKTSVAHLHELGLLSPHFVAAHSVWVDEDDIARFADSGVMVAHNPASNLKLGSGLAHARGLMERGVKVGIGTDGSRSSDNQNMFEAMRLACFTSRVIGRQESEWLSAKETFAAATVVGAEVLGWSGQIGVIRPKAKADLVFLNLSDFNYKPLNDPLAQVVFCEDGAGVNSVMIDGRFVLRNGVFTTFDVATLGRRVDAVIEDMRRANANAKARSEQVEAHVRAFAQSLTSRAYHISRFSGHASARL